MEYFILYEVLNDRRHYHLLMLTKHFFVIVWQLPGLLCWRQMTMEKPLEMKQSTAEAPGHNTDDTC